MRRAVTIAVLAGLALSAAPAAASAAETRRLSIDRPAERTCADRLLRADSPGVARERWTAPAEGYLTLKLGGDPLAPDWDLATFAPGFGEATGASTSSGSLEQVNLWVEAGDRIAIQACRLAGGDAELPLSFELYEMAIPEPSGERFSLESVAISGAEDVERLEALRLDVTHDVTADSATVALYSDAERALLAANGFESETLIRDLVARDRAQLERSASLQARSNLPSTRDSYRVYEDYTSEMKALVTSYPNHVRRVVLGQSLEGRPIEGVEIAANVNGDDGRPVYLNFGLTHAREWPSGEFPMEFALDLAQNFGSEPRVTAMLERVRVVIAPVVNPDGFIASRSFGTSPADDNFEANISQIAAGTGAYRRKNCRGITPADQAIPCAARTSGVDLNRNYGAYWGGPGSSNNPGTQNYRGTAPFSEPESQAVRDYTATIHPTVFVTNHTFTDGRWLRQPGFDAEFLPQTDLGQDYADNCGMGTMGAITPDEPAMKALGDAMAAANEPDWISELGYETLCDITGATEDWNYFNQGTYGYTPEAKGPNFHANYASMVVAEYLGNDGDGSDFDGMRGAFVVAGEEAGDTDNHGVIEGNAPPGATLRLRKEFKTPTCEDSTCAEGNGPPLDDVLDTRLAVGSSGTYSWHVMPSGRPLHPGETWSMSCRQEGQERSEPEQVAIGRGQVVPVNWRGRCGIEQTGPGAPSPARCKGQVATIVGTAGREALRGTGRNDVIAARAGDDRVRTGAGRDLVCAGGGRDRIRGGSGKDKLHGNGGRDRLAGGAGADRLVGGGSADRLHGGKGRDRCPDAGKRDQVRGC
jgi:murein tripeptide amidase MpaA